jgi:hypothetical protein
MSDISLQRYKARRAFQSLKEDKHMDNSEYVKLKSVIQNVKETRNDVVEEAAVAALPQNLVYVFIVDNTFNFSSEDRISTSSMADDPPLRYITSLNIFNGLSGIQTGTPDTETMIDHRTDDLTDSEDMVMNFDLLNRDTTNVYHYIKIFINNITLNDTTTNTVATAISNAIGHSVTESLTSDYDTIIKRVIVGCGVSDIKSTYTGFVSDDSFAHNIYGYYSNYVDDLAESTASYHLIDYVDRIITEINDSYDSGYLSHTLSAEYEPSNTIVLYPNNNSTFTVSSVTTDYNLHASIFFRLKMKEQNEAHGYTLLYEEWSGETDIDIALGAITDSATKYSDTNILKADTLLSLGAQLAGIVEFD